jgi:hypothetical protein
MFCRPERSLRSWQSFGLVVFKNDSVPIRQQLPQGSDLPTLSLYGQSLRSPHIHNVLVSLPQTPSLTYRRHHFVHLHIYYKRTNERTTCSAARAMADISWLRFVFSNDIASLLTPPTISSSLFLFASPSNLLRAFAIVYLFPAATFQRPEPALSIRSFPHTPRCPTPNTLLASVWCQPFAPCCLSTSTRES